MATEKRKPATSVQNFLDQFRALMEREGISRAELARRLDCGEANVTKLLQGESNLNSLTIEKLARAVGVEVNIQLTDPNRAAAGPAEGNGSDHEASEAVTAAPEPPPAKPLTRRDEARAQALAAAKQLPPEVLAEIAKITPKAGNPVGRPRGPVYNYTPHHHQMALHLASGETTSETEAAELALKWAKEQGLARVTPGTLQRHFRKDREAHLERARLELANQRKAAAAKDAGAEAPNRARRRASGVGGTGPGSAGHGRSLSSYGSVGRELDLLQDRFSLTREIMDSLRTPYVLEELSKIVAENQGLDALRSLGGPDKDHLTAIGTIPKEVWMGAAQMEHVLSSKGLTGRAAEDLMSVTVTQLARQPNVTDIIMEKSRLIEELSFSRLYRDDLFK